MTLLIEMIIAPKRHCWSCDQRLQSVQEMLVKNPPTGRQAPTSAFQIVFSVGIRGFHVKKIGAVVGLLTNDTKTFRRCW
jgi:hypothetical protein